MLIHRNPEVYPHSSSFTATSINVHSHTFRSESHATHFLIYQAHPHSCAFIRPIHILGRPHFWWSTFLIICKHTDGFMHINDLRSFDLRSHSDVTFMLIFSSCVKRSHLRTYRSKHAGGQYQCMRWEPK